jgi:hypothetical protein
LLLLFTGLLDDFVFKCHQLIGDLFKLIQNVGARGVKRLGFVQTTKCILLFSIFFVVILLNDSIILFFAD